MKRTPRGSQGDSVTPVLAVTHTIDLDPRDWMRATWRPRTPLPRPAVPDEPFDLDAALRLLTTSDRLIPWKLKVPPPRSRTEAHFWLLALTSKDMVEMGASKPLVKRLRKVTFSGQLSLANIEKCFQGWGNPSFFLDEILNTLSVLLSPEQALTFVLNGTGWPDGKRFCDSPPYWWPEDVLAWFSREMFPYLTNEALEAARPLLRREIKAHPWPSDPQRLAFPHPAYYLAALAGLHEELLVVVSAWPNNAYNNSSVSEGWDEDWHQPQRVVFGLGSARLVESHMRRLQLRLKKPSYVRAWLAHTELSALDYVRDSVLAVTRKPIAEWLVEPLGCVKAAEAAPVMLELRQALRGAQQATKWLEEQVGNAVAGLVPVAAAEGGSRIPALDYLRETCRKGLTAVVEEHIARAPRQVAERIRSCVLRPEQLARPLDEASAPNWLRDTAEKPGKLPDWVAPTTLPRIMVGERCLNVDQVLWLLAALKKSPLGKPLPPIGALKQHADGRSLEAFAWRLFERWLVQDGPTKDKWAMTALGHLGGDIAVHKLVPMIRTWPAESLSTRAVHGLECLRAINTPDALAELELIAQDRKLKNLAKRARDLLLGVKK
jgi:hypothetical protein